MTNQALQQYAKLTEFLGHTLGPDYEVALHDLSDQEHSIIAIANNHVTERNIGESLTSVEQKLLDQKAYEGRDYLLHYRGMTGNGKMLRSSTMFIRENNALAGMLTINFDDSRYYAVTEAILRLCHPDNYVETKFLIDADRIAAAARMQTSTGNTARDAAMQKLSELHLEPNQLTAEDRHKIITALEAQECFLMKGAVKEVAEVLNCSQVTIYRSIKQIREKKGNMP